MIEFHAARTPNGRKIAIMLEECAAPYETHLVDIGNGEQFHPDFTRINPNGKIPAIVDRDAPEPVIVFESAAILIYLAEKFRDVNAAEPTGSRHVHELDDLAGGQCRADVRPSTPLHQQGPRNVPARDRAVFDRSSASAACDGQAAFRGSLPRRRLLDCGHRRIPVDQSGARTDGQRTARSGGRYVSCSTLVRGHKCTPRCAKRLGDGTLAPNLPLRSRAAGCDNRRERIGHGGEFVHDDRAVELVENAPAFLGGRGYPGLLQNLQVTRHDGAILRKAIGNFSDIGSTQFDHLPNNFETRRLAECLEKIRVKDGKARVCGGGAGQLFHDSYYVQGGAHIKMHASLRSYEKHRCEPPARCPKICGLPLVEACDGQQHFAGIRVEAHVELPLHALVV